MPTPIEQLLSRTVYDTDGTTTVWDFSFASGYLDPSHVKAYTTDAARLRTDITVTVPMLIGEFQLQITPALADNLVLTVYRDTPKDAPLVNFTDESGFSEIALDTNAKQAVMVAAEAIDTVNSSDLQGAIEAAENATTAAATAVSAAASVVADAEAAEIAAAAAEVFAASINPASFATAAQGTKADSALQLTSLSGAADKATPADADVFAFLDSAASFTIKKLTWANIKSVLSALFALRGANSDITSLSGLTTPLSRAQGGTGNALGALGPIVNLPDPTLAGGAMTLPAATAPMTVSFRSATLGTGVPVDVTGTPPALVIPSGATLGTVSGVQSTIVQVLLNNLEPAVINLAGGVDLSETGVINTTAIGAASDSANVFYSTTACTGVAYRVVRIITSTQATAGTWATAPSTIQGTGGNSLVGVNGGMAFLGKATASASAVIDFTTNITSTYDEYLFVLVGVLPATDDAQLIMRFSQDGGATFKAGAADYSMHGYTSGNNAVSVLNSTTTYLPISSNASFTAGDGGICGEVRLFQPSSTTKKKLVKTNTGNFRTAIGMYDVSASGRYVTDTNAVNAVRFLMTSGNITSGEIYMYGVRKA